MKQRIAVAMVIVGLGLTGCASRKKVELVYDDPVTSVWTEQPLQRTAPAGAAALPPPSEPPQPVQTNPSAVRSPGAIPPASALGGSVQPTTTSDTPDDAAMPPSAQPFPSQNTPQVAVPPAPYPTESAVPPGAAPGYPAMPTNAQQPPPPSAPPSNAWRNKAPATGFPDESVTTYVVPDPNPTTATTLKRKSGWVRGGYD